MRCLKCSLFLLLLLLGFVAAANDRFVGDDFSRKSYASKNITDVTFVSVNFQKANFNDSVLQRVTFQDCDLSGSTFHRAHLNSVKFYNIRAPKISFWQAWLEWTQFENSYLPHADFNQSNAENLDFVSVQASFSSFSHAVFKRVTLTRVDVEKSLYKNSHFSEMLVDGMPIEESPIGFASPPYTTYPLTNFLLPYWGVDFISQRKGWFQPEWLNQGRISPIHITHAKEPSRDCIAKFPSYTQLGRIGNSPLSLTDGFDFHPCYTTCERQMDVQFKINFESIPIELRNDFEIQVNFDAPYPRLTSSVPGKILKKAIRIPLNGKEQFDLHFQNEDAFSLCEINLVRTSK